MKTIELQSYIETQKKTKQYIETELRNIVAIIENLKKNKPVRWYNNAYYFTKRYLFLFFAIIAILAILAILIFPNEIRSLFNQHLSSIITEYLNETFGIKTVVSGHIETPFSDGSFEEKSRINIKDSLQIKIVDQIYNVFYFGSIALLLLTALSSWYIARLTKKLRLKNTVIGNYYDATLDIADVYREVIEEKRYEIDFLTKIAEQK